MGEGGCVLDLEREEDPKVLRQATKILIHENEQLLEPPKGRCDYADRQNPFDFTASKGRAHFQAQVASAA
jgi:hypothetical protein